MLPGIRLAGRGYGQLTGLTSAKGLPAIGSPAAIPPDATCAVIVASGQAVRWRDDGTAPTASVGMHLAVGTEFIYTGNLSAIQFIQETATAVVDVTYYKAVG